MMEAQQLEDDSVVPLMMMEEGMEQDMPQEKENSISINVKTLNEKAFLVNVNTNLSIKELKNIISETIDSKDKYLRLIYQGKLIAEDTATLADYKVKNLDFIHCAVSSVQPRPRTSSLPSEEVINRRGFNSLLDRLSYDDVQALRLHFYPQIANLVAQSQPREGESTEDRIYRIEEEWMNSQGPHSEFALNTRPRSNVAIIEEQRVDLPAELRYSLLNADYNGNSIDLIWGLLMGLLLGFILLFWLWERSVPRMQKIGIVVGVALNIIIGVLPKHSTIE